MTHEQKPESAEFRTREAQADDAELCLKHHAVCVGWDGKIVRAVFLSEFEEAEARGAAEQRLEEEQSIEEAKDEGANFVLTSLAALFGKDGFEIRDGSETWEGDVHATLEGILEAGGLIDDEGAIRNVAALESRVKELEGVNKAWSDAAANALTWLENGRQANARDELKAAQRRAAAIREGGEHG